MFPNRQKLNINGVWLFIPDPEKVGEEKQWYLHPPLERGIEFILPMTEPIPDTTDSCTLWFIKEFDIQDFPENSLIFIHLQNVNFKSVLWLNGHYIGTHEGAFTKFDFNITRYAQVGKNLLVIKVLPFFQSLQSVSTLFTYNSSWKEYPGIWGNIYIEFVPSHYIQNVQVRPDIRGKRVVTNVYVNCRNFVIKAKIPELDINIESNKPKLIMPLKNFETWGPDSPKLYTMQIEYTTDTSSDFAVIPFGMRDFSVNDNQFALNFKPFYVKAFQFHWSFKDINSPLCSNDNLKEFFSKLRKANFNLIMSHGQPLPEKIIHICDEIGIMVAETPSLQYDTNSKKWRELSEKEIEELLNQYINNPSLVWLRFEYNSQNFNISNFVHKIREIDRSRLITIYPSSPISEYPSYYCIPYNIDLLPIKQIWTQPLESINKTMQFFLEHIGDERTLNYIIQTDSQEIENKEITLGNKYECYMSKIKEGFVERDLNLTLNSIENFFEQIRDIYISNLRIYVNSILWNTHIKGYCLSNILEKEFIHSNSFLDYLKLPENLHRQLRQINSNFQLILALGKTNILQDEETGIKVSYVLQNNENILLEAEQKASLSIHISSPSQQVLWKKKKDIKLKKDNKELWVGDISGSGNIGHHTLVARLSINNKIVSEISRSIYVFPTPQPTNVPVEIIDVYKEYSKLCSPWIKEPTTFPPLYMIPPIYNSIFAYPEKEFISMLEHIRNGAIGIIFSPPDDWNELNKWFPNLPQFTNMGLDYPNEFQHFHYVKPHPLFFNLPNRCVMKQEYRNILPSKVFLEKGDEDICGCLIIPQKGDKEPFWASDIIVNRYGVGKLVFTHLKILENIPDDPMAVHLLVNMVNYFSRRAIPSNEDIFVPQNILEQFRSQRNNNLRKWMVLGVFPVTEKTSVEEIYQNANAIDLTAKYWGKYGEITWKPYYTNKKDHHLLDFYKALSVPLNFYHMIQDSGVAFAFAEFNYEDKEEVIIQLETSNIFKLWFNNEEILENLNSSSQVQIFEAKVSLRKWKNSIFIKIIKDKGNHSFTINFYDAQRKKININW